jgi:hypothetical protein
MASVVMAITIAGEARGQLGVIEGFAKQVTDIGMYGQLAWPTAHSEVVPKGQHWNGVGFELSFTAATGRRIADPRIRNAITSFNNSELKLAYDSVTRERVFAKLADSLAAIGLILQKAVVDPQVKVPGYLPSGAPRVTAVEEIREYWARDTVTHRDTLIKRRFTITPQDAAQPALDTIYTIEFALSYAQSQPFSLPLPPVAPGVGGGEVRGGYREFPAAAVYYTRVEPWTNSGWFMAPLRRWSPYAGMYAGVVNLINLRAYSPNPSLASGQPAGMMTFRGEGSTFELGGILGLSRDITPDLHFYVEGEYTYRTIPSVDWQGAPTNVSYPTTLPKTLDLSGPSLTFGIQVHVGKAG